MQEFIKTYRSSLVAAESATEASNASGNITYGDAIAEAAEAMYALRAADKKGIIVGNGGSAGIASHLAIDFSKNGKLRCMAFNDASLLTCLSNDYSYKDAFAKAVNIYADTGDILLAISSSGSSANILAAVDAAKEKGCKVITLSGFNPDNPLRKSGDINFFVPSKSYGMVEVLHTYIIHCILDTMLYCKDHIEIFMSNKGLE